MALGSSGRLGLPGVKQGVSVPSHACRSCPDFVRSFAGSWTGKRDGRKVAGRDRAGRNWRRMNALEEVWRKIRGDRGGLEKKEGMTQTKAEWPHAQDDHSAGDSSFFREGVQGLQRAGAAGHVVARQHDGKMRARCAPASDHRHLVQRVDQVRHQAAAGGVADVAVVCRRRCFTEEFFVAQQVLELQGQGFRTGFGKLARSIAI